MVYAKKLHKALIKKQSHVPFLTPSQLPWVFSNHDQEHHTVELALSQESPTKR